MATDDDELTSFMREEAALGAERARAQQARPPVLTRIGGQVAPAPARDPHNFGTGESFALGMARGGTFDFADEIGGVANMAMSRLPPAVREGLGRPLLEQAGIAPADAEMVAKLGTARGPMGYAESRDAIRLAQSTSQQQNPVATGAGVVAGSLPAAILAPGAGATTVPGAIGQGAAVGAGMGALSGAGASEGDTFGQVAMDALKGSAIGGVLGAAGGALQRFLGGRADRAVARNEARELQSVGATAKTVGRAKARDGTIASNSDEVLALIREDKALRRAVGDPRKTVEATQEATKPLLARRDAIYEAADSSSKFGGVDAAAARAALDAALDKATKTGAPVGQLSRMRQVIKQFDEITTESLVPDVSKGNALRVSARTAEQRSKDLLAQAAQVDARAASQEAAGKLSPAAAARVLARGFREEAGRASAEAQELTDESARVSQGVPVPVVKASALRKFITDKLEPTGGEKLSGAAKAVQDAALSLKSQLMKHVGKSAGELDELNRKVSTYAIIEDGALRAYDKARYAPPAPGTIKDQLVKARDKTAGVPGVAEATVRQGAVTNAAQPSKPGTEAPPKEDDGKASARALLSAARARDTKTLQDLTSQAVLGP